MPRSTFSNLSLPSFLANPGQEVSDNGHQIDWANITAGAGVVPALNAQGKKWLKAGTPVGRLLGAGKVGPRVDTTNPAIGLLRTTAVQDDPQAALSGYGVVRGNAVVYENAIPGATGTPALLPQDIKDELAANGVGWSWVQYVDSRVS